MNLEIINKLYLELSQIATAKTGRENYLEILLEKKDKEMEDVAKQAVEDYKASLVPVSCYIPNGAYFKDDLSDYHASTLYELPSVLGETK